MNKSPGDTIFSRPADERTSIDLFIAGPLPIPDGIQQVATLGAVVSLLVAVAIVVIACVESC